MWRSLGSDWAKTVEDDAEIMSVAKKKLMFLNCYWGLTYFTDFMMELRSTHLYYYKFQISNL